MSKSPVNYGDYLGLNKLLNAQEPLSWKTDQPSHDEMLFIITHQSYELWFKQILTEVDSIIRVFAADTVEERTMGLVVARLERIIEIFKLLTQQIDVIETMTPLDFLDFRNLLFPASGFQSFQFREVEIKFGLREGDRQHYNSAPYHLHFKTDEGAKLQSLERQESLFDCLQKWLERTPFVKTKNFDFWGHYQTAVAQMFQFERQIVQNNSILGPEEKKQNLAQIQLSENGFNSLFNEAEFEQLQKDGQWRLSLKANRAALFIQIYRDYPVLHLPFRLIMALMNIDETVTTWRYRHALMARRMLGTKIGTSGSSGHEYLRASAEKHKIFSDLFRLTTFLIPRKSIPLLPAEVEKTLSFRYENM